ncbi:type II toxin-antitoxin system RelE/ParE family toxin [Pseudidiomarina homiensis]|uniref:type II toxin-antitoxin system RelE/ParE family toxin n=1 Tax=Pseudidiomarina homiensis TaxID=364198 RepID=UPI00215ACB26|nr:type II toxin-antitoxin system RelE/ParE family toxin [Pseudidiomarina homiensis]
MAYKLSRLAAADFANIYGYTLLQFGAKQADKYLHELKQKLEILVAHPQLGRSCEELFADSLGDLRRHEHHQHTIYYRCDTDDIFVVRILHQQMNASDYLARTPSDTD